jgi:hypothetical protein
MTHLHQFPKNPGYLTAELTAQQLEPIWQEVRAIEQGQTALPANKILAGNIKQEYFLQQCFDHVEQLVAPYINDYIRGFEYEEFLEQTGVKRPLELTQLWVNFQRAGEFNPPHWHRGQFSFVIWLQVPYTFEEEAKVSAGREGNCMVNGDFHFQWINSLGQLRNHSLLIDHTKEATLCLFPSRMFHTVYAFSTSDQARISVSGNWGFRL